MHFSVVNTVAGTSVALSTPSTGVWHDLGWLDECPGAVSHAVASWHWFESIAAITSSGMTRITEAGIKWHCCSLALGCCCASKPHAQCAATNNGRFIKKLMQHNHTHNNNRILNPNQMKASTSLYMTIKQPHTYCYCSTTSLLHQSLGANGQLCSSWK